LNSDHFCEKEPFHNAAPWSEIVIDIVSNRRPLKSRSTRWAAMLTQAILRTPLTPDAISLLGIAFAGFGAAAFLLTPEGQRWWLVAALGIQLRLLANMMDGLVAVEGGRFSSTGPLFNEIPDRIEDSLLLIAAGYAAQAPALGWTAALFAIGTAYVRALGGSFGLQQDFAGPMAKQHRMAILTLGALVSTAIPDASIMTVTLGIIVVGTMWTAGRRLARLAGSLQEAAQ
jgi:phosphatidylglycerophosphate synthase